MVDRLHHFPEYSGRKDRIAFVFEVVDGLRLSNYRIQPITNLLTKLIVDVFLHDLMQYVNKMHHILQNKIWIIHNRGLKKANITWLISADVFKTLISDRIFPPVFVVKMPPLRLINREPFAFHGVA